MTNMRQTPTASVNSVIELDEATVRQMMVFGFAKWNEQDKLYEMTEKGHIWLNDYLDKKFQEHGVERNP